MTFVTFVEVAATYYELYNERWRDLLAPDGAPEPRLAGRNDDYLLIVAVVLPMLAVYNPTLITSAHFKHHD